MTHDIDMDELWQVTAKIINESQTLMAKFFSGNLSHPFFGLIDLQRLWLSYQNVMLASYVDIAKNPFRLWQEMGQFWLEHTQLLSSINQQILTGKVTDTIKPEIRDRRFKHPSWRKRIFFHYLKQVYLLFTKHLTALYEQLKSLDDFSANQARFYIRLLTETLAPSNFFITNPEIQELTIEKHGLNLLKGLAHYLEDLNLWHGYINLKKTELDAFTPGDNIAYTKGQVVYRNELMELIQYQATTEKVYRQPLLIVTSWINKYYVLDLKANNSLIKWAVDQGFSVFTISWINPDTPQGEYGFEDYINLGIIQSLKWITEQLKVKQVHGLGFCLGGTLLGAASAYLSAVNQPLLKSLTLIATLLDFTDAGLITHYTGEEQIQCFEHSMQRQGYWDGRKMVMAFNTLQSNDFIWPYFINQYLRGNPPLALDSLYWSLDMTHSPRKLYQFYLRSLLQNNLLAKKGEITLNGVDLDLGKINLPSYNVAMRNDHISPWQSCYNNIQLLNGEKRFILVDAGHVAGVINPPTKNKYRYHYNEHLADQAEHWEQQAQNNKGSWWPDWGTWLIAQSSKTLITPKAIKDSLEAAPGRYVKRRIVDE